MLFPWSKTIHRRELLAQPFPVTWAGHLSAVAPCHSSKPSRNPHGSFFSFSGSFAEAGWSASV